MVFYFTGTGNSLYVAKQFDPKPISVPQVMRNKNENFCRQHWSCRAYLWTRAAAYGQGISERSRFANKLLFI